jgi:cysteine-rich repeat protein
MFGVAQILEDGVTCTEGSCDEDLDVVVQTAIDSSCDDQDLCNGAEFCDLNLGCQDGTPLPLDDGIDCTLDSCDSLTGAITHEENDEFCDLGASCTTYTCDKTQNGCVPEIILDCCGNDIMEPGEECDDGNIEENDGCTTACFVEWVLVFEHDLTSLPAGGIMEEEYPDTGQGPSEAGGVPCWSQESIWNALWIPHPDPNKTRTAIELDLYRHVSSQIRIFNMAEKTGFAQFNSFVWVEADGSHKSIRQCISQETAGCEYLHYDTTSGVPANTWTHYRVEFDRVTDEMKWFMDGLPMGTWTIDTGSIDGQWITLHSSGAADGPPKACWTNMKIYVQGESPDPP